MSEHNEDMLDDEAEDKRARWTFNLVVFFLLLPFAIDLSYMTYSIVPVGVGVSVIAWRVARTPEITNPISSCAGSRLREFLRNLGIALGPAFILLGVSMFATTNRFEEYPIGFPFSITYPISGCATPGFPTLFLAYDPVLVVLNYLFWVGLSIVILTLAGWVRTRGAKLHSKEQLPKKSSARGNRSIQCFQNTNFLGRDLESKQPCWLNNSKLRRSSSTSPSLRSSR